MPLPAIFKTLIPAAWDDGTPLLVATVGPLGPNIAPKGSMIVYDDEHLAWWERSKKGVLENLGHDRRVCIMYASFKAQRDGVLEFGLRALLRHRRAARERAGARRASSRCCCRASRRMPAPTPASARWSRSTRRSTPAARSSCEAGAPAALRSGGAVGGRLETTRRVRSFPGPRP